MQVRKIKEKKAEKRTRNAPSTSSSSGSPERSGEGDEAKNKKQVGNKEGFGRRRVMGNFFHSTQRRQLEDEWSRLPSQMSDSELQTWMIQIKAVKVKFITGDMLAWGHIIKPRIWQIIRQRHVILGLCLLPPQLSMFHEYEFHLRPSKTLIKYVRDRKLVSRWDDIKILGLVVCPFVCLCVCGTLISKISRCPTRKILRVSD